MLAVGDRSGVPVVLIAAPRAGGRGPYPLGAIRSPAGQRGSFLLETMIGLAIGLLILAGTLTLFESTRKKNADVVQSTRLNSELRATMDLIVRELRRASYWGNSAQGTWSTGNQTVVANPFNALDTATAGQITYRYDVDGDGAVGSGETFRIALDTGTAGVVFSVLDGAGNATSSTPFSDTDLTVVSALTFNAVDRTATTTCLKSGAGPVAPTPPVLHLRLVNVTLTGALRSAPAATRTLTESVNVRNDRIEGSCP